MQFKERGEWRHGNEYSTQTPKKSTLFSGQYLCNRSTLDIGVLCYIGIVWPKERSPEVWSVPPVTPCMNYRCYQTRLSAKYLYTNRKWWEVLTGYLSLGLAVIGRMRDIGHKVLQFPWQTGSSSSPSYLNIFFLISFLEEAFIRDIKITLCINYVVIIRHNDDNGVINNNLWKSPRRYFALLNPLGHSTAVNSKFMDSLDTRHQKVSPALTKSLSHWWFKIASSTFWTP